MWYQIEHQRFVTDLFHSTMVHHSNQVSTSEPRVPTFKPHTTIDPHFWIRDSPISTHWHKMMHDIQSNVTTTTTTLVISLITISNKQYIIHNRGDKTSCGTSSRPTHPPKNGGLDWDFGPAYPPALSSPKKGAGWPANLVTNHSKYLFWLIEG